jgi:hypothetical protein
MGDVFNAFGLSNQSYTATNANSLLITLAADLKAKDFTTFATENTLPKGSLLIADHAYEVDSVTTNSAGTPVSVTLRNPWGNDVANGGYVTITAAQAFTAFDGGVVARA